MQDLIRGIGKILNKGKAIKESARDSVIVQSGFGERAATLVKRGNMALEDREWERADGFFEQALNENAECGEAYFGKMLAAMKCSSIEEWAESIKAVETEIKEETEEKEACDVDTKRNMGYVFF